MFRRAGGCLLRAGRALPHTLARLRGRRRGARGAGQIFREVADASGQSMSFEAARKLADAVLLEGYVLYPYRASSAKNRFRWAFGVLAPRAWSEAGGCEEWWMESQCLVEPEARVHGVLRFLHAQARIIEDVEGRPLESLECGGRLLLPWDEGEVRETELRAPLEREHAMSFSLAASEAIEDARSPGGELAGRT